MQVATFGGGCFWCTEAVFQRLKGVLRVCSGYAGGVTESPSYRAVCNGSTGHAEVIQLEFDPEVIAYEDLLRIHLTTHDPTTLNQQGADRGTQYRSIILAHDQQQKQTALEVIDELQAAFNDPIVTEVVDYERFYAAEDEHQNFYNTHQSYGYCQAVIDPKLSKFQQLYKEKLKS